MTDTDKIIDAFAELVADRIVQKIEESLGLRPVAARRRYDGRVTIAVHVRRTVIARDGFRCHLCAGDVDPSDVHLDHLLPVSRGGGNEPENLRVAHSRCNIRRGNRELPT